MTNGVPPVSLSAEQYARLAEVSPIHNVANVTCPTLVLLSEQDLRLSPSQGKAWYHGLRAAGKAKTACYMYRGETHLMDGIEAEWQAHRSTMRWYAQAGGVTKTEDAKADEKDGAQAGLAGQNDATQKNGANGSTGDQAVCAKSERKEETRAPLATVAEE
jgi:hypothetical protein